MLKQIAKELYAFTFFNHIFLKLLLCKIIKHNKPEKVAYQRVISLIIRVADDAVENDTPNNFKREILLSSALPIPPGKREMAPIKPEDKWINADSLKFISVLKLFKIKKKLIPSRIQEKVPRNVEIRITLKLIKGLVLRFIIKLSKL